MRGNSIPIGAQPIYIAKESEMIPLFFLPMSELHSNK